MYVLQPPDLAQFAEQRLLAALDNCRCPLLLCVDLIRQGKIGNAAREVQGFLAVEIVVLCGAVLLPREQKQIAYFVNVAISFLPRREPRMPDAPVGRILRKHMLDSDNAVVV